VSHLLSEFRVNEDKQVFELLYNQLINRILGLVRTYLQSWNENEDLLEEDYSGIADFLSNIDFPFSNKIIGKKIKEERLNSPVTAMYLLYYSCSPKKSKDNEYQKIRENLTRIINYNNPTSLQKSYRNNEEERAKANRILSNVEFFSGDKDKLELRKRIADLETELVKVKENFKESEKEFENWKGMEKEKYSEWFNKVQDDSKRKFISYLRKTLRRKNGYIKSINSFLDESKNTLSESHQTVENAKKVYLSQVELAAAVTYWSEKKDIHGTSKKIGLGVLIFLLLLTAGSPLLVNWLVSLTELSDAPLILDLINPLTLITSVLVISLLSFTLRLSSKHYSTQQHLYLEAEERKTMLKTYLALMNEGKLVEQEDRKVALDALFRPAQTGMVADTGNIVPTDSIIRIVERQSAQAKPQ